MSKVIAKIVYPNLGIIDEIEEEIIDNADEDLNEETRKERPGCRY